MRLDLALVQRNLCETREEAKDCIERGYVLLDNIVVTKKTRQVTETSSIRVTNTRKFVSRGGDKLEGALLHIYKDEKSIHKHLQNKKAMDVGSSTGGFTDCLLSYGVASIICVDVGTAQFHQKLKNDPRIELFENTDIRNFKEKHLQEKSFNIIVADVSFISLEKIMPTLLTFAYPDTELLLLIKPQFEVGYGNTKKGIVKNMKLVDGILLKYQQIFVSHSLQNCQIFPCSVQGGDGNQEYFIYGRK